MRIFNHICVILAGIMIFLYGCEFAYMTILVAIGHGSYWMASLAFVVSGLLWWVGVTTISIEVRRWLRHNKK